MSTKVTIRARQATPTAPGFHLYEECFQEEDKPSVYLLLDGVAVEMQTLPAGGATLTIALPRDLALELGLLRTGSTGNPSG